MAEHCNMKFTWDFDRQQRTGHRIRIGFPQVRDGSDWVLDGGKCWISNSMEAGVFVVFANADPSKGHRGVSETWENMSEKFGKHIKMTQNVPKICGRCASIQHGKTFKYQFRWKTFLCSREASQRLWWTWTTKVCRSARRTAETFVISTDRVLLRQCKAPAIVIGRT